MGRVRTTRLRFDFGFFNNALTLYSRLLQEENQRHADGNEYPFYVGEAKTYR